MVSAMAGPLALFATTEHGQDGDEMPIFNPSRLLALRPSGSLNRIRCDLLDPCLEATC
jgi:hypothetical protein